MKKLFATVKNDKKPTSIVPKCGICGLNKKCKTPKIPVTGKGKRKILIVGEAPGKLEDEEGKLFIGNAGEYLRDELEDIGIEPDRDCWFTNAVRCKPHKNKTPDATQIDACRCNLLNSIKKLKPNVIILLGKSAVVSLIETIYKSINTVTPWVGQKIPSIDYNAWICPNYHPSFVLQNKNEVTGKLFQYYLKQAVKKYKSKPWKTIPDYEKEVSIITEPRKAANAIHKITKAGGLTAFDYETTCLKPEYPGAEIITCSICWQGKKTIAYPWCKRTAKATKKYIRANIPKIASNLKFEERWTKTILNTKVNNWNWDTMLAAHALNNTPGIASIKFQSLVKLGLKSYDEHIEPYLKTEQGKYTNRIKELDLQELLLYNGLDSLLEYKVANLQMRKLCS